MVQGRIATSITWKSGMFFLSPALLLVASETPCDKDDVPLRQCIDLPKVGFLAASLLARIGPAAHIALPQLYEAAQLGDGNRFSERSCHAEGALFAIAECGVAGFPYLQKLMNHANDQVRNNAERALETLCDSALPTLEEMFRVIVSSSLKHYLASDNNTRDYSKTITRKAGAFALPALAECVTNEESYTDEIRTEAAHWFGEMVAVLIKDKLKPILMSASHDKANSVRDAAEWSLRTIPDAWGEVASHQVTEREACEILRLALDSWVWQEGSKDFDEAHPDVTQGETIAARNGILLRYKISPVSYDGKSHRFDVTLVYQSRVGTEIKKRERFWVEMNASRWTIGP
jgi:hypothetical protein